MPVYEASYRPWDGKARPSRRAALAIAATMIPRLYKLKLVRIPVLVLPLAAILLSGMLFYFQYGTIFQTLARRLEWGDFPKRPRHLVPLLARGKGHGGSGRSCLYAGR